MSRRYVTSEAIHRHNFRVGLAVIWTIAALCYLAFGGPVPVRSHYKVDAVVGLSTGLPANTPVRIAGVKVGQVVGTRRGPAGTAIVTLQIADQGLPLHRDATLKVRPRLFLEGNFLIDLHPGSPAAGNLPDGATIPLSQTAIPVQLDQVLTTLDVSGRDGLRTILDQYAVALAHGGAEAVNRSFKPSERAFAGLAVSAQSARGLSRGDLARLITSSERILRGIHLRRDRLGALVASFDRTVTALAAQRRALGATVRGLAATVRDSPRALDELERAMPALRAFSGDVRPLLRRAPRTLDLSLPFLRAAGHLLGRRSLPALTASLRPTLPRLARLERPLGDLLAKVTPVARCVTRNVVPTLEARLDDGPLSTGRPAYAEFLDGLVGLAGSSQDFDGNGASVRYLAGFGNQLVSYGRLPDATTLFTFLGVPLIGSRPAKPDRQPPYRPDVSCASQDPPDLRAAMRPAPAMTPMRGRAG